MDKEQQQEAERRVERRQNSQRKLAWIAMITMIVFTVFLFAPIIPEARAKILVDVATLFYISQSGVVAAYMGSEAFVNRSKTHGSGPAGMP